MNGLSRYKTKVREIQKKFPGVFSAFFERVAAPVSGRALTVVSCLLLVLIGALFFRSLSGSAPVSLQSSLLGFLPEPDAGASVVIMSAVRGEFPGKAAHFVADTSAVGHRVSWMAHFIPIFDSSDASALLVAGGDKNLSVCGVFVPGLEEYDLLETGELPMAWRRFFSAAELRRAYRDGVYRLSADDLPGPVYIAVTDGMVFVTGSTEEIDRIMAVNDGSAQGIRKKWAVEPQWGGHVYLSDGGLIFERLNGDEAVSARGRSVEIEAAWVTSDDARVSAVKWELSGAENIVNRSFLGDLRPGEWSGIDMFIPDPLVMSFGVNLPNPGRSMQNLPGPLRYVAEQMRKMGMRRSEIQAILTGRSVFSLGGRTKLLWFELPGVVIDLRGRGAASLKLIDKFWSELFVGTSPKPLEGFSRGGMTNLPFTVLAAANDDETVVGLVPPDTEQNFEVEDLLAASAPAAAWAYIDIPLLGSSLAELPALNSVMYEDGDEVPLDEESADNLKSIMSSLGRVFITLESAASGSAMCYY
jgi:hypothetical protein